MFAKVVVGADASETAAEAVRSAMELAQRYGSELHIVTAYKAKIAEARSGGVPEEFRFSLLTNPADVLLSELASWAKQYGLDPTVHASTAGPGRGHCGGRHRRAGRPHRGRQQGDARRPPGAGQRAELCGPRRAVRGPHRDDDQLT